MVARERPPALAERIRETVRQRRHSHAPAWRQTRWQRLIGKRFFRNGGRTTAYSMLPTLIRVFAGLAKADGQIDEQDIDSTLSFLRYDYPEAVYSELRDLYSRALQEPQNLEEMAVQLSRRLSQEEKLLLGVQLFVLTSRGKDLQREQLLTFYRFMTELGMAAEAIELVYQLSTGDDALPPSPDGRNHPLETLHISGREPADVVVDSLSGEHALAAYRFQSLVLVKNTGRLPVIVRGRELGSGEFCRVYQGQRILLSDFVLSYQDLLFYFSSKKHLSSARLFLGLNSAGVPYLESSSSKQSALEIEFGLRIGVEVLRDIAGTINGVRLRRGVRLNASLHDRIVFDNRTEIGFLELRRRAREMGGHFELHPSRSEYLVSNNPNLLRPGDILLSATDMDEVLLRIRCDYEHKTGRLEVLHAAQPVLIEGQPVRETAHLIDGAVITIAEGQFLRCQFSDGIIEEQRNIISRIEIRDVSHAYDGRESALDGVTLNARRGEMICVMGPSGCGKSTLLRVLSGHLRPRSGDILLNGLSLYEHSEALTPYIAYIPQEDSFDALLTVWENMDCAVRVRAPHLRTAERRRRVDAKLIELGLSERRHRLAGTPKVKYLSGGERKRLNLGMDMIGDGDVYLIDEPTSGLSSKDSEHVLEIIRELSANKIVFVSIHQPNSRLFHRFDKALLLDHGGKIAFYGTPEEMLAYFETAQQESAVHRERGAQIRTEPGSETPAARRTPDFIFDVLETPLRDLTGTVIYEEDSRGHLVPARRFSPNYWRDRFQAHRTLRELAAAEPGVSTPGQRPAPPPKRVSPSLREERVHFTTLLERSFLSKLRNRGNLATTLLEAPFLALLISAVLRYSEEGHYTFSSAFHIPTYLFLTLVVAMFLGLTSSADEILRDRSTLTRERNYRVRRIHYLASKMLTLGFFGLCQCVIYLLVANAILEIHGMFFHHLLWMFLTTMAGVATGLVISSLVNDAKTALNIIPVILIPQIILGGALIKYEEMNRNLDFIYSMRRWTERDANDFSDLRVPFICEFMPLRWSYEALVVAQARDNPVARLQQKFETEIRRLSEIPNHTPEQSRRFRDLKNALPIIHSLEAPYPRKLKRQLARVDRHIDGRRFNSERFTRDIPDPKVNARQVFVNRKVEDLVLRAEAEYFHERPEAKHPPNVFFGLRKHYFGLSLPTLRINFLVMLFCIVLTFAALYLILRRQLTRT